MAENRCASSMWSAGVRPPVEVVSLTWTDFIHVDEMAMLGESLPKSHIPILAVPYMSKSAAAHCEKGEWHGWICPATLRSGRRACTCMYWDTGTSMLALAVLKARSLRKAPGWRGGSL